MSIFYLENGGELKAMFAQHNAYGSQITTPEQNFTLFYQGKEFYVTSVTDYLNGIKFTYKPSYTLYYVFASFFADRLHCPANMRMQVYSSSQSAISVADTMVAYFPAQSVTITAGLLIGERYLLPIFKAQLARCAAFYWVKKVKIDGKTQKLINMLYENKSEYEFAGRYYLAREVFDTTSAYLARYNALEQSFPVEERIIANVYAEKPDIAFDLRVMVTINVGATTTELNSQKLYLKSNTAKPLGVSEQQIAERNAFGDTSELYYFMQKGSAQVCFDSDALYIYQLEPFKMERLDAYWAASKRDFELFGCKLSVLGYLSAYYLTVKQAIAGQFEYSADYQDTKLIIKNTDSVIDDKYDVKKAIYTNLVALVYNAAEVASAPAQYEKEYDSVPQSYAQFEQEQALKKQIAEKARYYKLEYELYRQKQNREAKLREEYVKYTALLYQQIEEDKAAKSHHYEMLQAKVDDYRYYLQMQKEEGDRIDAYRYRKLVEQKDQELQRYIEHYRYYLAYQKTDDGAYMYTEVYIDYLIRYRFGEYYQKLSGMKAKCSARQHLDYVLYNYIEAYQRAKDEQEAKRRYLEERHKRYQIEMEKKQHQKELEEYQFLYKFNYTVEERKIYRYRELEEKYLLRAKLLDEERYKQEEQKYALQYAQEAYYLEKQQKYAELYQKIAYYHEQYLEEKKRQVELRRKQREELERRSQLRAYEFEKRKLERQLRDNELKYKTTRLRKLQEESKYQEKLRAFEEKQKVFVPPVRGCKTDIRESKTRRIVYHTDNKSESYHVRDEEFEDNLRRRRQEAQIEYEKYQELYKTVRERTANQMLQEREQRERERIYQLREIREEQRRWEEHERQEYDKLEQINQYEEIERQMAEMEHQQNVMQRNQEWAYFWYKEERSRRKRVEKLKHDSYVCNDERYSCYFEVPQVVCVQFKTRARRCKSQLAPHQLTLDAI